MRKIISIAMMAACLIACTKEESITLSEEAQLADASEVDFTIVEETELSSSDFFRSTAGSLESADADLNLDELLQSYKEAESEQEAVDTKAACAPLLYKTARIKYTTRDECNKPVEVSALVVYPLLRKMDKVMLINHGTHVGMMMVPTYYTAVESVLAASGALCILPDYIGIGASSDHPDLYLNAKVHGTTSTDAFFALLAYAKKKNLPLDKKFDSYVIGYSQGGSTSLATLRAIQSLPKKKQAELRLKKVICGDGPYDLRCTFESFVRDEEEGKTMGLGAVIPLVINSMFNSYPDVMRKYNYEDFFTPWALSTGVPQAVRGNDETLCDMLIKLNGRKLSEILNFEYIERDREAYETLLSMMDRQNLCTGWSPAYPLQFFHCNPDGIVSYDNFLNAYAGLKNSYVLKPDTPCASLLEPTPLLQHMYGMTVMLNNVLKGLYY